MASQNMQDYGPCDEGGSHDFRLPKKSSGCCAGLASAPIGFSAGDDRPDEIVCTKCGLTPSEASALSQAKDAEAHGFSTSKGPGYFSNAGMSIPAPPAPTRSPSQRRSRPPSAAYSPSPNPSHGRARAPSDAHRSAAGYPPSPELAHSHSRPQSMVYPAPPLPQQEYYHPAAYRPEQQQQYQYEQPQRPQSQYYEPQQARPQSQYYEPQQAQARPQSQHLPFPGSADPQGPLRPEPGMEANPAVERWLGGLPPGAGMR
ncbi:hypothetical protein JCM10450v2_000702 [Rhodotorula kratochvilovae]